MKLSKYLNSGQKFVIQDEKGNVLAYPAYLKGLCVHHYDNDRESYSFFDTPENVSKQLSFFIEDHTDILMVDIQHHPEQKYNEIYFGNVVNPFSDEYHRGFDYYDCTGWKQKRYGKIAYDTSGEIINNMVPLFVKRQEIEAAIVKEKHKLTLNIDVHTAPDKIRVWQNMLDKGTIC